MIKAKKKHLKVLENESIYVLREVAANFQQPVVMYSIGKDSSVLIHLVRKAFYPEPIPFPLLHVDTGYKFKEMIAFRDEFTRKIGARLIVSRNEQAIAEGSHPAKYGVAKCCNLLKTTALLQGLAQGKFDAAIGGARRDEERSRAKERFFSLRDEFSQWDPKNQRPELWNLYNTRINENETMRVFPLSNWTEINIWEYIEQEAIPIVPIYYAQQRKVVKRNGMWLPVEYLTDLKPTEVVEERSVRFRSLGCSPCTGAVESSATTVADIIKEVEQAKRSERETRIIDHGNSSMEDKKKEGYF